MHYFSRRISIISSILISVMATSISYAGGLGSPLTEAKQALESDELVTVANKWHFIRFTPNTNVSSTCFIFYPGGLVSPRAYAPYARTMAEQGFLSYIVKVPLSLAILRPDAADKAKADSEAEQLCEKFVIGGHSLGGVIASGYVKSNPEHGLVLLAAYPQEDESLVDLNTQVVSIYGSNDCETTLEDISNSQAYLPGSTQFVLIEGANHSQFGCYRAEDEPECAASISRELQSSIFIERTLEFLRTF